MKRPDVPSADVIVIGGGVVGASVAYHLAVRGASVLVLERAALPGAGSTGRATGGFRAQFATGINVRLSLLSRAKLAAFRDETGVDPGYRPCGYLFLADNAREQAALRAAQRVQHDAGLREAVEVSPDEIRAIQPAIEPRGITGGVYCPTDGFLRPLEILRGYREASERLGARWLYGRAVTALEGASSGRITAVRSGVERHAASCVVNAAGAWAGEVARLAGVGLPVRPLRRQVALTEPFTGLPETMPMTIFVSDGFHLRVRDGRVLLLLPSESHPAPPFETAFEPAWLSDVVARARERVPCLAGAVIDRAACWAGLYEMSPDKHAILGAAGQVENLYLVNGSSGHGVMHSPALGQLLAELVVDGAPGAIDTSALRPSRFDEGCPNEGTEFL